MRPPFEYAPAPIRIRDQVPRRGAGRYHGFDQLRRSAGKDQHGEVRSGPFGADPGAEWHQAKASIFHEGDIGIHLGLIQTDSSIQIHLDLLIQKLTPLCFYVELAVAPGWGKNQCRRVAFPGEYDAGLIQDRVVIRIQ
jgi:hypothetical protein